MSVSCKESGIENIPFVTLHAMWTKAEEYLNSPSKVMPVPGDDKKAMMVSSKSGAVPHFVQSHPSGQYACDNSCIQWKSSHLCSHVIVVAERNNELSVFLEWYRSS